MKIEDQVCSFELANKLNGLGVKQESYFYWASIKNNQGKEYIGLHCPTHPLMSDISAFTVAELGELLPERFSSIRDPDWQACGVNTVVTKMNAKSNTEADCRAKMLIYLIENNLITTEEINKNE